jgi:hypothetical protein
MPKPILDHIQSLRNLSVDGLVKKIFETNEALVISDRHNGGEMETIGEMFPEFARSGVTAVFIETPKNYQDEVNEWVRTAKAEGGDHTPTTSIHGGRPLYYPAQQSGIPLICMDIPPPQMNGFENLGRGNTQEQIAAKEASIARNGLAATEAALAKFEEQRLKANDEWMKNIKEYIDSHPLPNGQKHKIVVIGGGGHQRGDNGIDDRIGNELGLRTVHISVSSRNTRGNSHRIIEPVISDYASPDGDKPADPQTHFHVFTATDVRLPAEEITKIKAIYNPLRTADVTDFRTVEFMKWKHAHAVMGIRECEQVFNETEGKNNVAACEFTALKKAGGITADDEQSIQKMNKLFKEAHAHLDHNPPEYGNAKEKLIAAKLIMNDFGGGADAFRKRCDSKSYNQFWMTTESYAHVIDETVEHISIAQGYADRQFGKLREKQAKTPVAEQDQPNTPAPQHSSGLPESVRRAATQVSPDR